MAGYQNQTYINYFIIIIIIIKVIQQNNNKNNNENMCVNIQQKKLNMIYNENLVI